MGKDQPSPGRVLVEVDPKKGTIISTSTEPTAQSQQNDGSDEAWTRQLIWHIENFRRVLEIRHTQILSKFDEIRQILTQVEVLSAQQIISRVATPVEEALRGPMVGLAQAGILYFPQFDRRPREEPPDLTGLIQRAWTLLAECESIDRGEFDVAGPEVNWARLDRMMALARSGSLEFRVRTDDMGAYSESQKDSANYDPWLSSNPLAIRAILDQLKKDLGSHRIGVARRQWERWLSEIAPRYQVILREAWPILEIADGPLTVNAIAARFRARYDSDEIGRALTMATKKGFLVNRKRKPQGYFIGERFPDLADPSK